MPKKDDADRHTVVQVELPPSDGLEIESLSVVMKYKYRSCEDPITLHIGGRIRTPKSGEPLYFELVAYDKKPNWLKEIPGG
jgi:hypothetical protein